MTELERFAGAVLAQWRADGGADDAPIAVSALIDRVLPYRVARRLLGIDVSEDYEALVLRLLAEEEELVQVSPTDAAELARATATSRLPDLGVLDLLRSASFRLSERVTVAAVEAAASASPKNTSHHAPKADGKRSTGRDEPAVVAAPALAPASVTIPVRAADAPDQLCWSCAEALPVGREVKFCPCCGADQRQPKCAACGVAAERGWKHCADCGAKL